MHFLNFFSKILSPLKRVNKLEKLGEALALMSHLAWVIDQQT
jgi:hypothetical protein